MFNEDEDWNDAQDVQVLEKAVPENTPKAKSSSNMKSKVVGKKSLLRTLQTLGSVPDWESNSRQQGSDSEAEAAPAHKKRKKRRKRRKQAEKSEEQEENVDSGVKQDAAGPKKKKKGNKLGAPNTNGFDAVKKKNEENPASDQVDAKIPANTEKISRQQWKNKMKNKRKSKNKYSQSKAVEDVDKEKDDKQESKAEVKPESQSMNNSESISLRAPQKKKMERQCKPLKRKHPGEEAPVPEARQQKAQKLQKSVKAGKRVHEPPADGSEQKAAQLQQELPDNQPQLPQNRPKFELSREQSLKRQKMQKMLLRREESPPGGEEEPAPAGEEEEEEEPAAAPSRSDALRSRMEQRLEAARFRYINELLYSTTSGEARRMFQQDPQAFWVYHKGYTAQVQRWPANPVEAIISFIRQKPSHLVVADFGCGDCKIARSVKNKVHSFDLASTCELVTVCDMASVPLGDGSVDIAVFCLSLMGTNLADFLTEANRVLKTGGVLKIAEVASRFDSDRNFVSSLASLGFKLVSKDTENSHFYSFDFVKTGNAPKNVKKYGLQLKPCLYKKR